MPTYQYECNTCAHDFEVLQSMTDPKLTQCPECKEDTLARLIGTGSGIIFKGNGFYETDYKKKDAPQETPKADKEAQTSPKSGEKASAKAADGGGCGPSCAH